MENIINLGDEVKCRLTGFRGIVTGVAEHLYGCRRCIVLRNKKSLDKGPEEFWFDEPQLELIKAAKKEKIVGPRKYGPLGYKV